MTGADDAGDPAVESVAADEAPTGRAGRVALAGITAVTVGFAAVAGWLVGVSADGQTVTLYGRVAVPATGPAVAAAGAAVTGSILALLAAAVAFAGRRDG